MASSSYSSDEDVQGFSPESLRSSPILHPVHSQSYPQFSQFDNTFNSYSAMSTSARWPKELPPAGVKSFQPSDRVQTAQCPLKNGFVHPATSHFRSNSMSPVLEKHSPPFFDSSTRPSREIWMPQTIVSPHRVCTLNIILTSNTA